MRIVTGKRRYRQVQQVIVCPGGYEPQEGTGWYLYAHRPQLYIAGVGGSLVLKEASIWRAGRGAELPDGGILLDRDLYPIGDEELSAALQRLRDAHKAAAEQILSAIPVPGAWNAAADMRTPYRADEAEVLEGIPPEEGLSFERQELVDEVRAFRGDANVFTHLWSAPWHLTLERAEQVARVATRLPQEIGHCSVLQEHGRWTYRTGAGGKTRVWGACDTLEEAEYMARAVLMKAWLDYLEELTMRAGGRTDWVGGVPIPPEGCEAVDREHAERLP